MQQAEIKQVNAVVNYDEAPIAELSVEGVDYRVDAGLGAVVAISQRQQGEWSWALLAEARFDGSRLRCKALSYEVNNALAKQLGEAMRESASVD